jgi:hypothetical protein
MYYREGRRFPPPWALVEKEECFMVVDGTGQPLAFVYFEDEPTRQSTLKRLGKDEAYIRANVNRESAVMTDSASWYKFLGAYVTIASHDTINHVDNEYVRREGEKTISTNTVEGYYSIFKRGMKGIYQHCAEKHLHRYLAEFDFRYSNRVALGVSDVARADRALKGIVGKRLTYRPPHN